MNPIEVNADLDLLGVNRVLSVAPPIDDGDLVNRGYMYAELALALEQEQEKRASRYLQNDPSSLWVIAHNLSYYPKVSVSELNGPVVSHGNVTHVDDNTLTIEFNPPLAGWAFMS